MVAAASIAVHLSQRGFAVRLVTADGEDPGTVWHDRASVINTGPLLESLAILEPARQGDIDTRWLPEASHSGLTVAVLGAVYERDQPALRRMRLHASSALAVALDVPLWSHPAGPGGTLEVTALANLGWRAVTLSPTDRLPAVWQELGRVSSNLSLAKSRAATLTGEVAG